MSGYIEVPHVDLTSDLHVQIVVPGGGSIEADVEHQPTRRRWYAVVRAQHTAEALHRSGWGGAVGKAISGTFATRIDATTMTDLWIFAARAWLSGPIDPDGDYGAGECPACRAHWHELHRADCRSRNARLA